jgi:hypothetical protein
LLVLKFMKTQKHGGWGPVTLRFLIFVDAFGRLQDVRGAVGISLADFRAKRGNREKEKDAPEDLKLEQDGKVVWVKGEVKKDEAGEEWVYGVKKTKLFGDDEYEYECRYEASIGNLKYYEVQDCNYLARLLASEGELRKQEPAVWAMWVRAGCPADIGKLWRDFLTEHNYYKTPATDTKEVDAALAAAEKDAENHSAELLELERKARQNVLEEAKREKERKAEEQHKEAALMAQVDRLVEQKVEQKLARQAQSKQAQLLAAQPIFAISPPQEQKLSQEIAHIKSQLAAQQREKQTQDVSLLHRLDVLESTVAQAASPRDDKLVLDLSNRMRRLEQQHESAIAQVKRQLEAKTGDEKQLQSKLEELQRQGEARMLFDLRRGIEIQFTRFIAQNEEQP